MKTPGAKMPGIKAEMPRKTAEIPGKTAKILGKSPEVPGTKFVPLKGLNKCCSILVNVMNYKKCQNRRV